MCGSAYSLERKPWKKEDTQSKVVLSKLFTCGQLLLHIRVDNVIELGALVPGVYRYQLTLIAYPASK